MLTSIIIRTYNEERYLDDLLASIGRQQVTFGVEVIVVDSGSTDRTVEIALARGATVVRIEKSDFSFGRSLNRGCEAGSGDTFVFVSGHCVPASDMWLASLLAPIRAGLVPMTYGRQVGGDATKFSEHQLFDKFYPAATSVPQNGFFCNNANSAISRGVWERFPFDEELTGLEDMHLGKTLVEAGHRIGYVAEAAVVHHHHETWAGVKRRYEREAIALQHILPEIHMTIRDFARYFSRAVLHDSIAARRLGQLRRIPEIIMFRLMQFWGSYRGNHEHRQLSQGQKERYFYPKGTHGEVVGLSHRSGAPSTRSTSSTTPPTDVSVAYRRPAADEGQQRAGEGKELSQFRGQAALSLDT